MIRVRREVVHAVVALAIVLALGLAFPGEGSAFYRAGTHADALWNIAGYGILACGMTIVILSGGIDLSVGSVVALSGMAFAILSMRHDLSGWVAIPAGILTGSACGLVSGAAIAYLRVQPFIATLAMMAFARGLAKSSLMSGNTKVIEFPPPASFELLTARVGGAGISVGVFVFAACVVLAAILLRTLRFGVQIYAVGDNETAARFAAVPVRATKLLAYVVCGSLAGLAGVLFAATERQGNPDAGMGYELTAIAMVVVGGTSLSGGRGGISLTLLGALTIGYLRKILDINAVDTAWQLMITGAIILLAVLVQGSRR